MQVKICGLTSVEDARAAIEAGADAIGLNFVPGTPRALDPERALEISRLAVGRVLRVGVFQDAAPERIEELVESVGLDAVQLHGQESPAYVAKLRYPVIVVLRGDDSLEAQAARYPAADLLIDHPGGGGSGKSWNFELARSLVSRGRRVWLAGGLSAENVAAAVRAAHPTG